MPPYIIELMPAAEEAHARLAEIPNLTVSTGTLLSRYTRFAIGGPADLYAETTDAEAFIAARADCSAAMFARIAASGIASISPAPTGGVGIRKIKLWRACSA